MANEKWVFTIEGRECSIVRSRDSTDGLLRFDARVGAATTFSGCTSFSSAMGAIGREIQILIDKRLDGEGLDDWLQGKTNAWPLNISPHFGGATRLRWHRNRVQMSDRHYTFSREHATRLVRGLLEYRKSSNSSRRDLIVEGHMPHKISDKIFGYGCKRFLWEDIERLAKVLLKGEKDEVSAKKPAAAARKRSTSAARKRPAVRKKVGSGTPTIAPNKGTRTVRRARNTAR